MESTLQAGHSGPHIENVAASNAHGAPHFEGIPKPLICADAGCIADRYPDHRQQRKISDILWCFRHFSIVHFSASSEVDHLKDGIVRRLNAVVLSIRAKEKGTVSRSLEDRNKVG